VNLHHKRRKHGPPSNSGFYFLTGGGAYYLPAGSGDDGSAYADNGTADDADDADNVDNGAATDDSQSADAAPSADDAASATNASDVAREIGSNEAAQAPLRDEGEFTLVLRDGTRIQAMAFTHANKNIVYITTDGMRRAFADSQLDAGETVRVNQERGTALQSPL